VLFVLPILTLVFRINPSNSETLWDVS
jgi:hypothetical protein